MPTISLLGLASSLADLVQPALEAEGFTVVRVPLDADAVRALAKRTPDALVIDGEAYVDTRAFLADLRSRPETGRLPVVLLGQGEPAEVAQFEIVEQLGRSLDLGKLLAAVGRVAGPLPG
ncbi:MAG TPA: hypothetical protein VNM48_15750 [Chloroflexota bacterium]|nr:hypothetical protein [Chloroflexota bacterium]